MPAVIPYSFKQEVLDSVDSVDVICFFFQAEDGIRDVAVTGVQTCALPILFRSANCTSSALVSSVLDSPVFSIFDFSCTSPRRFNSLISLRRGRSSIEALSAMKSSASFPFSREPLTPPRSEEHTSELQSRLHLVCRLLLEKK